MKAPLKLDAQPVGQMTEIALLRVPAVCQLTGYCRSSIYSLIKQGKFPSPVSLAGGGAVAWRSADVRAWIEAQPKRALA